MGLRFTKIVIDALSFFLKCLLHRYKNMPSTSDLSYFN